MLCCCYGVGMYRKKATECTGILAIVPKSISAGCYGAALVSDGAMESYGAHLFSKFAELRIYILGSG